MRKTTHSVRWCVNGKEFRESFANAAQADAFRAELLAATKKGTPFLVLSGLPINYESSAAGISWYDFAIAFVDERWAHTSGNTRKTTAKVLMATTMALLKKQPVTYQPVAVRTALREYAFNRSRRSQAPDDVVRILEWVRRNTPTMAVWEDPAAVHRLLAALDLKLDGTPVAASSVRRTRRVLNVVLTLAISRRVLHTNPLPKGRSATARKPANTVDKRSLPNTQQAARLLARVRSRPRGGPRLHAFFATLYYAAARPEEAVALRVADIRLPGQDVPDRWGELVLHTATPEVGGQWTDTGHRYEERGLKGRAAGETRPVPCHPALVRILRDHITREKLAPTDRLFQGAEGGELAGSVIRRMWRSARKSELTDAEHDSPLARRIYDLRHTCLTGWLNAGIPPAQVAAWAGNSVPVLLSTYAHCVTGQQAELLKRIEQAQDLTTLYPTEEDLTEDLLADCSAYSPWATESPHDKEHTTNVSVAEFPHPRHLRLVANTRADLRKRG
ncbi:tyrosine-type recombinase/integrase [Streptomyces sp. NBRC 109706]|uniref:tyrosine-type recombinase/integrase n=1 Tax=Streptomyces sp. NBRC 109706 TaxID=1550035 RepID=UPI001F2E39B4|nr:tyrosine-type recombinase/integrase [Streptomyces sp. NBRC 109706]